ncbi:MAG: hypothetical protein QHC65_04185 [Sphingomonas sp.]|nr:hypothetical protein [Sphingomonas sp.]MDX3883597.1 hypothetical protein [Sphingomonas sp.]
MSIVTKAIGKGLGGLLKAVGLVSTPGKPPAALPSVTRDTAAEQQRDQDELRRRRGSAADIVTGPDGAEAVLSGGKLILG